MVLKPPNCPHCPRRPPLWKDTSLTAPTAADNWRWHCAGCRREWEPTREHRERYGDGVPDEPGFRPGRPAVDPGGRPSVRPAVAP